MSDFIHTELIIYFNCKYKHLFSVIQLLEQQREMFTWKQECAGKVADRVMTVIAVVVSVWTIMAYSYILLKAIKWESHNASKNKGNAVLIIPIYSPRTHIFFSIAFASGSYGSDADTCIH